MDEICLSHDEAAELLLSIDALRANLDHDDMFSGEYGAARLRLLDHIEAKLRALV